MGNNYLLNNSNKLSNHNINNGNNGHVNSNNPLNVCNNYSNNFGPGSSDCNSPVALNSSSCPVTSIQASALASSSPSSVYTPPDSSALMPLMVNDSSPISNSSMHHQHHQQHHTAALSPLCIPQTSSHSLGPSSSAAAAAVMNSFAASSTAVPPPVFTGFGCTTGPMSNNLCALYNAPTTGFNAVNLIGNSQATVSPMVAGHSMTANGNNGPMLMLDPSSSSSSMMNGYAMHAANLDYFNTIGMMSSTGSNGSNGGGVGGSGIILGGVNDLHLNETIAVGSSSSNATGNNQLMNELKMEETHLQSNNGGELCNWNDMCKIWKVLEISLNDFFFPSCWLAIFSRISLRKIS